MTRVTEVRVTAGNASTEPGSVIADLGEAMHTVLAARLGQLAEALRDALRRAALL
jgi:hypothetical protein